MSSCPRHCKPEHVSALLHNNRACGGNTGKLAAHPGVLATLGARSCGHSNSASSLGPSPENAGATASLGKSISSRTCRASPFTLATQSPSTAPCKPLQGTLRVPWTFATGNRTAISSSSHTSLGLLRDAHESYNLSQNRRARSPSGGVLVHHQTAHARAPHSFVPSVPCDRFHKILARPVCTVHDSGRSEGFNFARHHFPV